MPEDWTLAVAVARRLIDFLRHEGLLTLRVLPRDVLPARLDDLLAALAHKSPVFTRLFQSVSDREVRDVLSETLFRDVLRAARNDAFAFFVSCAEIDDLYSLSSGIGKSTAVEPLGSATDGPVDQVSLANTLLTTATARDTLAALPPSVLLGLLYQLPNRVRNALMRSQGGPERVRAFLLTASSADLLDVRGLSAAHAAHLQNMLPGLLADADPVGRWRPEAGESGTWAPPVIAPPDPPAIPDYAALILGADPRFSDLFHGILSDQTNLATAVSSSPNDRAHQLVDSVTSRMDQIAASTLENEGTTLVAAAAGIEVANPRASAIAARYGLHGDEPATMDDIARVIGVSRARIGQITQRIAKRLPAGTLWAPVADQVVLTVGSLLPCSMAELNSTLLDAGLTRHTWTAEALASATRLTGRELDLQEYDGFAATSVDLPMLRAVATTARRVSARNGAAAVGQVQIEISEDVETDASLIREFLSSRPDVTWLSDEWFWTAHSGRRNRLVNTSVRILVVQEPQSLESMASGVERNYIWRNATGGTGRAPELKVPPIEVLRSFYGSHPDFNIDGAGRIRLTRTVGEEILGEEKLTLVRILRDQPWPAMTRNDLIDACVAEGMASATAGIFITYAECIENISHNVWAIRGAEVPEEVVLDLQDDARARSRNFDRGRREGTTAGGRPWFAQRLTSTVLHTGVVTSRWTSNLDVDARLAVIDGTDGEAAGTLKRSGSQFLYGLSIFLRRNRPAVGDYLRVTLYEQDGFAVAEVGGEELAEAPDDWT